MRNYSSKTRVQHDATRVKYEATRDNTSTTQDNTSTIRHSTSINNTAQHEYKGSPTAKIGLYFALFVPELSIFLISFRDS